MQKIYSGRLLVNSRNLDAIGSLLISRPPIPPHTHTLNIYLKANQVIEGFNEDI